MSKRKPQRRAARRKFDPLPADPDLPITGAQSIAIAAKFIKDGEPDTDRIYNGVRAGYYDGIIHKQGRLLITTLNLLRQVGARSVAPSKTA